MLLIELTVLGGGAALLRKLKPKNAKPSSSAVLQAARSSAVQRARSSYVQQAARGNQQPLFDGKKLVVDLKNAIWGDERDHQQISLDPDMRDKIERRKKKEKRDLVLSAGATGLALLGSVSPGFYVLGSAAVLYMGRNLFRLVWQDLKQRHFISVYLVSAILILSMIATGNLVLAAMAGLVGGFMVKLVKKAEENSQKHLIEVFSGHPSQVWLEKDGVEIQVAFETLQKNDVVVVHAGEIVPVDGVVKTGSASIDQHILTGESQPVERGVGDAVFAATLVLAGRIGILVETAGEKTVVANIGRILNETKNYKEHLVLRGKKIADRMLPIELGAGLVTLGLLGPAAAMAVLWSGLGARMTIYGPISVLNYLQIFSRQGILVKDGRVLESLLKVDTVVFDKTGTLTLEQPSIGTVHLLGHYDEHQVLRFAAGAEYRQSHPIAKAIIDKALEQGVTLPTPDATSYELGYGIKIQLEQKTVCVGSARFMQREGLALPDRLDDIQRQAEGQGHSLVYVGIDNELAGILEMQPSIRPEAHQVIEYLQQRGLSTYIISGDHEQPTRNIAEQLGIDHYFAETLPERKADLIKQLRDEGKFVCFIGDGINDAIALKSAQISVSLKGASSAATDAAQIVFMNGTLTPLTQLFELTDKFEHTMHNNLLLSIAPGTLNISGVYLLHIGIAASMGIFYAGTTVGLFNTVLPLVKNQDSPANFSQTNANE